MKSTVSIHALIGLIVLGSLVGCNHGSARIRNGSYAVSGGGDTAELIHASSAARVQEMNAETYQDCMLSGLCYGYGGGAYNSDYGVAYRDVGAMRGTTAVSGPHAAAPNATAPAQAEDACAREMAADALRGVRSLDRDEEMALKGAPSCKKAGAQ